MELNARVNSWTSCGPATSSGFTSAEGIPRAALTTFCNGLAIHPETRNARINERINAVPPPATMTGINSSLKIFKTEFRGRGVVTIRKVPSGSFSIEYSHAAPFTSRINGKARVNRFTVGKTSSACSELVSKNGWRSLENKTTRTLNVCALRIAKVEIGGASASLNRSTINVLTALSRSVVWRYRSGLRKREINRTIVTTLKAMTMRKV